MPTWVATLLLLAVTAVWGWTFVVVKEAIAIYGVMPFLAVRFAIAATVTLVLWGIRLRLRTCVVGMGIGAVLAIGYLFQTWGLRFTTATSSGLITGLFVVLAPIADRALYGTRLRPLSWLAVALSVVGMILLTGRLPNQLAIGELLTLGCASAFGVHIALLSRHSRNHDARSLGAAQMLGVALLFLALWPLTAPVEPPPRAVWPALIITGVVASALAYFIQTVAQRSLTTVRTAVVLTTEPLFAGLFGYLLAHELLSSSQLVGAALILAAVVTSEVVPALRASRRSQVD
jgi:drug/metabolite transporter (DMT)-like permease